MGISNEFELILQDLKKEKSLTYHMPTLFIFIIFFPFPLETSGQSYGHQRKGEDEREKKVLAWVGLFFFTN